MSQPAALFFPSVGEAPRVVELLEEMANRLQGGEAVDVEAFLAEHPAEAERLRPLLPAVQILAELGRSRSASEPPTEPNGEPLPHTLGDFRILREVGRGGMGIVYEAEQLSLGRRVALKVLPFAATMDARQLQRFQNEARAAAGLHHTNIVPVHFVGCERGVHYYAMQFIEGQNLASVLVQLREQAGRKASASRIGATVDAAEGEAVAPAAVPAVDSTPLAGLSTERSARSPEYFRTMARMGIQAAEALDHAHQMGIVHRDVKPANLLVDAMGRLWVTDFGLAYILSDARLTMTGDLVGTLRYMSPEQALAKRVVVDHRTDIYSLGATLYELLTLQPAFDGKDRQELLRQIAFDEPRRPRRWNRSIPHDLETIILKALERNPADRYATAQELADDLRNYLEDRAIRARRPSLLNRCGRWCRRHKAPVFGVLAVVLTILLLGGAVFWREQLQQQHQLAALEQKISEDLREADLLQKQERWPEALQVLERASGRLATGGPSRLRASVEQRRKNVALVAELEEARLQKLYLGDVKWGEIRDYEGADRRYKAALVGYGLDLEVLSPEEASQRIRASVIYVPLIVALDDWAFVKEQLRSGSGEPLLEVARLADDDPWRQQLRDPEVRRDQAALERLAEAEGVLAQPPDNLLLLCWAVDATKGRAAAVRLLRRAQQRHPGDFWINLDLGIDLSDEPATRAEALGFLRVALALRPHNPAVYMTLAFVLRAEKQLPEAEFACRKAIEIKPDYSEAYNGLAEVLCDQSKWDEALKESRKAIAFNPTFAAPHNGLGKVWERLAEVKKAEAEYRKAVALDPTVALYHHNLGIVLWTEYRLEEAVQECLKAIKLDPINPWRHCGLGLVLADQGRPIEAEAEYRKVIELAPKNSTFHIVVGLFLKNEGRPIEAEEEFRKAIELDPKTGSHKALGDLLKGQAHSWEDLVLLQLHDALGDVLKDQGRLEEAKAEYRAAMELRRMKEASIQLRTFERQLALRPRLPDLAAGRDRPANQVERLEFALLCQEPFERRYALSARLYADAFAADPKLADNLSPQYRYKAACAAALAGCGRGEDTLKLDDKEKSRLRNQALAWLRADQKNLTWLVNYQNPPWHPARQLGNWRIAPDLACVRGDALAMLPQEEQEAWRQLWADVADTLKKALSPKP